MRIQGLKRYISVVLALAASGATWAQDPPEKSAANHLAGLLVNDARDALRDTALSPDAAAVQATVTIGWSGLVAGTRYLGVVDYIDGSNTIGSTIVAVNP